MTHRYRPTYDHSVYAESMRRMYVERGYPLRKIADILRVDYGVVLSRNTVKRVLNSLGVDTSKSALRKEVTCATCGAVKRVPRYQYRLYNGDERTTPGRNGEVNRWQHHCDEVCWLVYLEEHCANHQVALRMVADILNQSLPAGAVAHFINGDTSDVRRANIRVFTSTRAHVDVHRRELEADSK